MSTPGPVDLEALGDLRTPWCIRVVATLRIAEHIAAGATTIDRLAASARCDADLLRCLLGHLVSRGVFEETAPAEFALNDAARQLLDPAQHLGFDLDGIGGRMAHAWGTLLAVVRTGQPEYRQCFGRPFWEDLDAHPAIGAGFDALMGPVGHGTPDPSFEITGGWGAVRAVVDVGGGTGAMLAGILRARPEIHGTLVDLPRAVARSAATFAAAGVADRVTTIGQSFFDPLPSGADLYLLRGVLNDWPDREAAAILTRCAAAAGPGGRVVVLKSIDLEDVPASPTIEIEAVLLGGRRRTLTQFRELAGAAGLAVTAAGRQPSGHPVVECRPTTAT